MYQKRKQLELSPLELGGDRYHRWKSELLLMERHLLKELGFSLYSIMDHPHKYLLYFVKLLNGTFELSQKAWNYLNDSLRLDLSVRHKSNDIVCASIYLAARILHFPLPIHPYPWWHVMTQDFHQVECIAETILSLHTLEKV